MSAIVVEGLRKQYGDHEAVRGIDLEVADGQVVCLLGPNGAGKTTTVEILEGYRNRTAGTVRVLGFDPAGQPLALRQRIGIVLQECALPADLRVAELLDAYRDYYPHPRPRDELLDIVELRDEAAKPIKALSGGQQRRLDLALALTGDPDLVFLDEPTTGFDPAARRRCWAAIRNLAALDKTVLLTTHYMDEAQELADRVAVLVDGLIVADDAPHRLAGRHLAATHVSFHLPEGRSGDDLPAVPGEIVAEGGKVVIATREPDVALYTLLAWARRRHLDLSGLAVAPPTLEDIYLELAGSGAAQ